MREKRSLVALKILVRYHNITHIGALQKSAERVKIKGHDAIGYCSLHLVKSKCFPVVFYGLEVCSLRKYQYKSINYVINNTFRKIFNTRSQETVDVCLEMFGCLQAERTIAIRKRKFLNKFSITHNALAGYSLPLLRQNLNHVARMFS